MKKATQNRISRLLPLFILAGMALSASTVSAGVKVWTTNGPVKTGTTAPLIDALAIDPSAPATLYAGASDGSSNSGGGDFGVFKSMDGGVSWTFRSDHLDFLQVNVLAIDPSAPATVYAATDSFDEPSGLFKSTDGGVNWTDSLRRNGARALVIDLSTPATLYASTVFHGVFKSTDRGASWTALDTGLTNSFVSVLTIDPSTSATIYAGTSDYNATSGGVLKSNNGGESWTAMNDGLTNNPVFALAIDPASPATLYAGTSGGVFKSTNAGGSWMVVNAGLTNTSVRALAIDPAGPAVLYTGTAGGGVFKSTNGGASWTAMNAGLSNLFVNALAIDPSTPARIYAGTDGGVYEYLQTAESCVPGATTLCLSGGRFEVTTEWTTAAGQSGSGQAVALAGGDAGYFTFFDPGNVEVAVKVLNGCSADGSFWIFAGGLTDVGVVMTVRDSQTGTAKSYENPLGTPFRPIQDIHTFSTCAAGVAAGAQPYGGSAAAVSLPSTVGESFEARATEPCLANATTLCVNNSRYQVRTQWFTQDGNSGSGQVVNLTGDTGAFWFFSPSNVEVVVKVLNGCGFDSRYWTFAGGLTDVHVILTVTDTRTGIVQTYTNPQGTPFEPIQDTDTFATCP